MTDDQVLAESLRNPALYDHPVESVKLIETHVSRVLLTGCYVYKIKKPLDLGFLDFSTLEKRRICCLDELRLNRRLAKDYYLDVVAITGTPQHPAINGDGPVIEYAVKMRQFPQPAQLDRMASRGRLEPRHMDLLAEKLAAFHHAIREPRTAGGFGDPQTIRRQAMENFQRIDKVIDDRDDRQRLQALRDWTEQEYQARRAVFAERKAHGFVRECHGDLHLRNIALVDNDPLIFDCIEFSQALRCIDVMSEIAFLVMDLDDHRLDRLAQRFLNGYLERTGDYAGLAVLRFYRVYRAMVRAMVGVLRSAQEDVDQRLREQLLDEFRGYLELAEKTRGDACPAIVITHGLSGSGKSTVAEALVEHWPAIRVRSDVERKRLFGLAAGANSRSATGDGLYSANASRETYARLASLATDVVASGYTAIIDATFLEQAERGRFRELAEHLQVPFVILHCQAPRDELRRRVRQRQRDGGDPSEANESVLKYQFAHADPITDAERPLVVEVDTRLPVDTRSLAGSIQRRIRRPRS